VPQTTFQSLCCEYFKCAPDQYEQRALRRFLYPHARLLVPLLRFLTPDLFSPDLKFIRRIGGASDLRDATNDVVDFNHLNSNGSGFWRTGLRLRVSGRKAGRLARLLFLEAANQRPKQGEGHRLKFQLR